MSSYQTTMYLPQIKSAGLTPGVHEVTIKAITVDRQFIEISFTSAKGGARMRLWTEPKIWGNETLLEAVANRDLKNIPQLVHIATTIVGIEKVSKLQAETYEDLMALLVKEINVAGPKPFLLKVVMDKDNKYSVVPSYFPFTEPIGGTTLKVNPKEMGEQKNAVVDDFPF